jgi:hypothetical protein
MARLISAQTRAHSVLFSSPPLRRRLLGNLGAALFAEVGASRATLAPQFGGGAPLRQRFFFLARDPHQLHGVADHISAALATWILGIGDHLRVMRADFALARFSVGPKDDPPSDLVKF